MNSRLLSLILLLHVQGTLTLDHLPVNCEPKNICAVGGDQITLRCIYSNINFKTGFWFSEKQSETWRKKEEPEDLMLDSDYAGRVSQLITNNQSELTITDLSETDSGEYQLMFIMKDGVKHLGSVNVNLTVTVLQVKMSHDSTNQLVNLTCDLTCNLTSAIYYDWYKNGQYLRYDTSPHMLLLSRGNTNSYSCLVYPYLNSLSPSVCVSNSSCWSVIYPSRSVCALVGSTVDIPSTYSHPTGYIVEKTLWHHSDSEEFIDLREEQQVAGCVEYVGNTLRIKDVKMSDSGEYRFRIISNTSDGNFSGLLGVILRVTDAMVTSSPDPVVEGEKVILSCSTQCSLDNKHTYIWYKNGQQVTDGFTLLNKLYLDSVSSEEIQQYSCVVRETTNRNNETIDRNNKTMDSSMFGHHTVCLLVFMPQFLIIGVLWMWFFISMTKRRTEKLN